MADVTVVKTSQGPRGRAGTMEVGSTSTLASDEDATVVNSGSSTEAVFDFGIPQGDPLTFRGVWDNTATYAQSEAVTHSDKLWAANADTDAGDEPGVSGKWTEIPTVNQILADTTFNIPTDYADLQTAIDDLADRFVQRGVVVTLNIESGTTVESTLDVSDGDYSMFRITSTDAEVPIGENMPTGQNMISGNNCRMPQLACLFDAQGNGGDRAYFISEASTGVVEAGAGVKNAPGDGIGVYDGSSCAASSSVWSGAGGYAVRISRGATINGDSIDATDNAAGPLAAAVYVNRGAMANLQGIDISGAANRGFYAHREGVINAHFATVDNVGGTVAEAFRGGEIAINGASGTGLGGPGLVANGGTIFADNISLTAGGSNSDNGCDTRYNSDVVLGDGTLDGFGGQGVSVSRGGRFSAGASGEVINSGNNGVWALTGGSASLDDTTVTGSGSDDLNMTEGGYIHAHDVTTSSSSSSGNNPDLADCNFGSFNAIESDQGICWA